MNNYKVVAITPAGRPEFLEILYKYILREIYNGTISEWHLWINADENDVLQTRRIQYIINLQKKHHWIKIFRLTVPYNGIFSIYSFFQNCIDENTIYIRFDDDIVWMEKNALNKFIDFRIENEDYFLVFPCIINNAIIAHIHQKNNSISQTPKITYDCFDHRFLTDSMIATKIHDQFINDIHENNLNKYRFEKTEIQKRFSINCFAFFGRDFKKFNGEVGFEEEEWLSELYPILTKKKNCIISEFIVSHFSFHNQNELTKNSLMLNRYKKLII